MVVVAGVVAGEGTQQSWNEREPRWHEVSPSSVGSRKDPDRIIPLGLSARDRVLPIWEPLYSSKAASWVGMLLERVILGVVAAVGLTGRTEGRGKERQGEGRRRGRVISSLGPLGNGAPGAWEANGQGWGQERKRWGWGECAGSCWLGVGSLPGRSSPNGEGPCREE